MCHGLGTRLEAEESVLRIECIQGPACRVSFRPEATCTGTHV
jgi:hypothetical protein